MKIVVISRIHSWLRLKVFSFLIISINAQKKPKKEKTVKIVSHKLWIIIFLLYTKQYLKHPNVTHEEKIGSKIVHSPKHATDSKNK